MSQKSISRAFYSITYYNGPLYGIDWRLKTLVCYNIAASNFVHDKKPPISTDDMEGITIEENYL